DRAVTGDRHAGRRAGDHTGVLGDEHAAAAVVDDRMRAGARGMGDGDREGVAGLAGLGAVDRLGRSLVVGALRGEADRGALVLGGRGDRDAADGQAQAQQAGTGARVVGDRAGHVPVPSVRVVRVVLVVLVVLAQAALAATVS